MAYGRDVFSCMFLRSTAGWLSRANFPAHPLFQHLIIRPTRVKEEAMAWSHDRKYGINALFHRQQTTRGMSPLTYQLLLLLLPEKENVISVATESSPYIQYKIFLTVFNLLKPNDIYICRTAALTSRRYILNIHSTNIYIY